MACSAGVDVGSTQTKAIVIDGDLRIAGRALIDTGANVVVAAERAFQAALLDAGLEDRAVGCVAGTGYGRYRVTFGDLQVTEISCHGRGAVHMFPLTRTVVDMGGQDTKAIKVNARGEIVDFCMNDKCAAGTGRFLEVILARLQIPLSAVAEHAARAARPVAISSTCTVFAETEVISLVAEGEPVEGIVAGLHASLASRVAALARAPRGTPVWMSGGVALNPAMIAALSQAIGPVRVVPEPQLVGALGAALSVVASLG